MKIRHDRWPRLLALAAHELRTPAGVVSGYTRMLLQGRAGPLDGPQRTTLEAADRSNVRLAELLDQMSDLAHLEDGTSGLNRAIAGLDTVLAASVHGTPVPAPVGPLPPVSLHLDASRIRAALVAVAALHRRKGVADPSLAARADASSVWLAIGAADAVADALASDSALDAFDDLQGGLGLALAVARVVIERHGGKMLSRPGGEPAREVTLIRLPQADPR